jgi:hypothetical protein
MKSSGSEGITLREGFASKSTDKMLDFTRIREGERGGGAELRFERGGDQLRFEWSGVGGVGGGDQPK